MSTNNNEQLAIVFDLGGVLIDWNRQYLYRGMFDGDEAELNNFLTTVCPLEWNAKQDAGRSFAEAIAERVHLFPEYTPYIQAYFSRWQEMIGGEITGTVHVLSALRDKGYPLYALSNWSAETYPLVRKRFEFFNWFREVILSGEEKIAKPDPAIYNILLHRINREAQQCLFIDDSEQNILAAKQLGFQTILYSSTEALYSELIGRKFDISLTVNR